MRLLSSLFVIFLISLPSLVTASDLPFTENFTTQANMCSSKTNANWSLAEQALYLA
jgi:hypothetical protein